MIIWSYHQILNLAETTIWLSLHSTTKGKQSFSGRISKQTPEMYIKCPFKIRFIVLAVADNHLGDHMFDNSRFWDQEG